MTETEDTKTEVDQEEPAYEHFEVIERLQISDEAADAISGALSELHLVKNKTDDGSHYLVRWHYDEGEGY